MKIAIFGYGYVGKAMHKMLQDHYTVCYKDIDNSSGDVNSCEVAIICVPTNMNADGSCDTSIVEQVIKETDFPLYLVKSTIPPGSTERIATENGKNIVFSPEYIGEGKYPVPHWKGLPHPTEMKLHDFQIFGGPRELTKRCVDIFTRVCGPYCRFFQTDSRTAELVKYMENSWLAMKVVFCHEFSLIVDVFDRDYREVRELFLADGRVERGSSAVFPGKLGFSGKCLPKDTEAIYAASQDAGYIPRLIESMIVVNEQLRKTDSK